MLVDYSSVMSGVNQQIIKSKNSIMILEIVALLIALYVIIKVYWNALIRPWSHLPSAPLKLYPLFGNVLSLVKLNVNEFLLEHIRWLNVSPTVIVWLGLRPNIVTKDVKVFEAIMSSNTVISRSLNYWIFEDWIGRQNTFISNGSIWRQRRKMLTPSFHFNILTELFPVFEKHSKSLVKCLKEREEKPFNAFKLMKKYSMGVILETAMGLENDYIAYAFDSTEWSDEENDVNTLITVLDRLLLILQKRNDVPWYWYKQIFKLFPTGREYYKILDYIHQFGNRIAEERVEILQTVGKGEMKESNIFMDHLLVYLRKGEFTIEDVLNETNGFLFAGYNTVATALSWCMFLLGSHPEIQKKAFEEAQKIKDMNLPIQEALKEMKYIQCVIKETLRVHPSVPIISRRVEEDIQIEGVLYPKGTDVVFCIMAMQRDEKTWPDALAFKPERFLVQDKERNSYSFVPFSAGPRNCIGQRFAMNELKLTLYELLLNFEIVSLQKAEELLETIGLGHGVLNEEGLLVKVKARIILNNGYL